jgi:hypothetical protein
MASLSFDIAADRYWIEVGQYSKETDLEENIAGRTQYTPGRDQRRYASPFSRPTQG